MTRISIIIPTLNEAAAIAASLRALQTLRGRGVEVIVVDGGSSDATIANASPYADLLIRAARGRALQMNAGAAAASGEALLFLHADTCLPVDADRAIYAHCPTNLAWGRFDMRLSGRHPGLRVIERLINWRSRLAGIATGDQAIFVTRELFDAIDGYPEIALMEDIALSKRLKRHARPGRVNAKVVSSSRRWESNGIARTVWLMWRLRLAYFLGADPGRLAQVYAGKGET